MSELPDKVLNRNVKTNPDFFSNQIQRMSKPRNHIDRARTAVKNIRRLGKVPDGRLRAMQLLIETAQRYCDEVVENNLRSDRFHNGEEELVRMEELMCDLVRAHYMACRISDVEWTIIKLVKKIEGVRCETSVPGYDYTERDSNRESLFDKAQELLETVENRQAAVKLATEVAGHILPPELVFMVADCLCSDDELRVTKYV